MFCFKKLMTTLSYCAWASFYSIKTCQILNWFGLVVVLQVVGLYRFLKQKCLMGESTAVWPWMQQERLTSTSTSPYLVSLNLRSLHFSLRFLSLFSTLSTCLSVPPSIRGNGGDYPDMVNVLIGKSVTLECESNAVPPPTIVWYKNGRVVTESANLRILAEGQILEIKNSEVTCLFSPQMSYYFLCIEFFVSSTALDTW